ncbi:MAG: flagellar export chaperone FliS [Woeseiaceae bacterium]
MYAPLSDPAKLYQSSAAEHAVDTDDGYTLIRKLLTRLMARLGMARHCLSENNVASKGEHLTRAIEIISVLQVAIDEQHSPELAGNLVSLYDYAARRLLHANLHNDLAALDEVEGLLREVKDAWDAIAPNE